MKFKKTILMLISSLVTCIASFAFDVTFVDVKGKVEFQDGGIWVKAQSGDVIEQGTVISTGYKSSAVIKSNNSSFTIGPMTRITLEKLARQSGKENTQLFLDSGSIQSDVKSGNRFKVRSAVATASVRGTSFTFYSSGRLNVNNGLVALSASEAGRASNADNIPETTEEPVIEDAVTANAVKSSVFTSTDEVGEVKGIPVFAKQAASANASGSGFSTPAQEKAKFVTSLSSSTSKTSELEAEKTSASSTSSSQGSSSKGAKASVKINISIKE